MIVPPFVLSRNPKESVEGADSESLAHDDNPQHIVSEDLVRPNKKAGLMPKLNQ